MGEVDNEVLEKIEYGETEDGKKIEIIPDVPIDKKKRVFTFPLDGGFGFEASPLTKHMKESLVVRLKVYTEAERLEITDIFMEIGATETKDVKTRNTLYRKYRLKSILYGIDSWNIKDGEGKDVPVTEENILKLPSKVTQALFEIISFINQPIDKEELKNL